MSENNDGQPQEIENNDGPMPSNSNSADHKHTRKKQRTLQYSKLFLDNLPEAEMYETSLMHRDIVCFVKMTKLHFLVTLSIDGHVKFWKKSNDTIEFVKHFRAHLGEIVSFDVSHDGTLLCTAAKDKGLKVFDVLNFDMINLFKLNYIPNAVCWIYQKGQSEALLACSEKLTKNINLYDGRGGSSIIKTISPHALPVHLIRYNPTCNTAVSIDEGGMVEYWTPDMSENSDQGFQFPTTKDVSFKYKSETDLLEFKKSKTTPTSLEFSPTFDKFVTFGFGDCQIRVFNFKTGKLFRKYDESIQAVSELQQCGNSARVLEDMEFRKRLAIEKEIGEIPEGGRIPEGPAVAAANVIFDESGNFILYPSLLGIKVVNLKTNKVERIIGINF